MILESTECNEIFIRLLKTILSLAKCFYTTVIRKFSKNRTENRSWAAFITAYFIADQLHYLLFVRNTFELKKS